jgi:hypothetical protein
MAALLALQRRTDVILTRRNEPGLVEPSPVVAVGAKDIHAVEQRRAAHSRGRIIRCMNSGTEASVSGSGERDVTMDAVMATGLEAFLGRFLGRW